MKKTIRLGSFLLAFLLMVCTLPVTAWAASTSYDLSRALFRSAETQKNVVSYAKGEKATLTFTPQYTAEYTLNFFVHNPNGESGRNAHASLTLPGGKVQEGEYPYRPNAKDYSSPYITATLEKGKTYTYHVWGWLPTSEGSAVDITFISGASGALTEELGLRAYLPDKTFYSYDPQAVLNELKLLVGFKNATQPLEWYYKNAGGVLSINGVDVIVDMSGCGAEGMNTMAVYYQGYRAEAKFKIRSHEHNYEAGDSVLPTCTTAGYTPYFCTICADEVHRDIVPALGHNYKEKSRALTRATTTKDGKRVYTYRCSVCGKQYTKTAQTYYKVNNIKLSKTAYTYNGKVQRPGVTVKNSKGKALKNGTDYKISYPKGMKNVGKYTVKVTLKGNYSGSKSMTYNINPKGTGVSKVKAAKKGFKVTWKKQRTQTTGYQVQYSTSSKFKKAKTVTVSKNKTTSKSVGKLSAKKKYYVRVRTYKTVKIGGKSVKLYSGWSKAKSVTTKK